MNTFKKYTSEIIIGAVLLIGYYLYKMGKKQGQIIDYPNNGAGIPQGWSPRPVVVTLQNAFCPSGSSWLCGVDGTDEQLIWGALDGLTDDQLSAVYNDFNSYTGENLLDKFNSELSGEDLTRALNYYAFISNRFSLGRMQRSIVSYDQYTIQQ